MARIETDPNYSSPTFSRATAPADPFKATDLQNVAAALSTHDHSTGKGVVLAAGSIPNGMITSAMIADGTIDTTDLKDGSITSAKIADGTIASVDLAAHAVTQSQFVQDSSAQSTTATSAAALPGMSVSLTTLSGSEVVVFFVGGFSHSTVGAIGTFYLQMDAAGYTPYARFTEAVASGIVMVSTLARFVIASAGAHTFNAGWSVSGGTLVADTGAFRSLVAVELRR